MDLDTIRSIVQRDLTAFSAYDRLQGWNKLADKWKEEAEEEWDEAEEVLNRLVELGCKPAELQELMKTIEFPFYDDPKQQIESLPDTWRCPRCKQPKARFNPA